MWWTNFKLKEKHMFLFTMQLLLWGLVMRFLCTKNSKFWRQTRTVWSVQLKAQSDFHIVWHLFVPSWRNECRIRSETWLSPQFTLAVAWQHGISIPLSTIFTWQLVIAKLWLVKLELILGSPTKICFSNWT